jgi:hypothetical protein
MFAIAWAGLGAVMIATFLARITRHYLRVRRHSGLDERSRS